MIPELLALTVAITCGVASETRLAAIPETDHSHDDPGKTKQSHAPNHAAMLDTQRRVETFFQQHLKP
jgi:hypothetical protein